MKEAVLAAVSAIPKGEARSYKQVANLAGFPRHARYVGALMSKNYRADIPCHRVIKSNREIGEYNRGVAAKEAKLRSEGVHIECRQGVCYVVE